MKYVLSNSSFNQPAPLSVLVDERVERSWSIACVAAYFFSLFSHVFPCVAFSGVISAISSFRSEFNCSIGIVLQMICYWATYLISIT